MAEGGSSTATARALPATAPPPRCCGLARLVRRLRRQGRRAALLCAAAASHSHQPRRHRAASCRQYDPLSYARNFDLGRDAADADADAARMYYACSFSSRFALVPAASSSSAVGAAAAPASLPVAATS